MMRVQRGVMFHTAWNLWGLKKEYEIVEQK